MPWYRARRASGQRRSRCRGARGPCRRAGHVLQGRRLRRLGRPRRCADAARRCALPGCQRRDCRPVHLELRLRACGRQHAEVRGLRQRASRGSRLHLGRDGQVPHRPEPAHALAALPHGGAARRWCAAAEPHLLCGQHLRLCAAAALQEALLSRRGPLPLLHRPPGPKRQREGHGFALPPAAAHLKDHVRGPAPL